MSSERWAILLEFVSFFLVTLDLFGKDGLESLEANMSFWLNKIKDLNIVKNHVSKLASTLTRLGLRPENGIQLYFWILWIGIIGIFLISIRVQYEYIMNISLFLSWAIVVFIILLPFILWLLNKLINMILLMLKKFHLKGIFLVVGVILFTISKAISFFL